ncbi:hypothetical protein LKI_01800 [Leuconostoc kimchii IMSNU 11154]|uniref:Uncharacterized protein n=1 Tax=Leuconostoc kimchii (strain IMSNU 11154 / KCTC 2386 / IH25) TaxID=762051 RepID=D5T0V4_LEUKI|nr:DUF1056 family protein [Leuconostoc kimchii]ADG39903.1 hypothetical protein LKI_01800 [Leuconostoc kimchii IMSNU 11154]
MIKNFTKLINTLWQNLLGVILFISGIVMIDIGVFSFNFIAGFIVTGISLVVMAVIVENERGE